MPQLATVASIASRIEDLESYAATVLAAPGPERSAPQGGSR